MSLRTPTIERRRELATRDPIADTVRIWAGAVDTSEVGWPASLELLQDDRKAAIVRVATTAGSALYVKRGEWSRLSPELGAYRGLTAWRERFAPALRGEAREGGTGWMVVDAVRGRAFDHERPDDQRSLATWLVRLHLSSTPPRPWMVSLPREPLRPCRRRVDERIDGLRRKLVTATKMSARVELRELLALVVRVRRSWADFEELAASAPHVLVHGDLGAENVIVRTDGTGRICAVDWEDVAFGAPLLDLGNVDIATYIRGAGDLWSNQARLQLPRMQAFARVLQTIRHRFERKPTKLRRMYLKRLRRYLSEARLQ